MINFKSTIDLVQAMLVKHPNLKDDDNRLIAMVYLHELGGLDKINKMSAFDLLSMLSKGNLTSPESIRRCRQKLQEKHPELRGKSYQLRQNKSIETRNTINKL